MSLPGSPTRQTARGLLMQTVSWGTGEWCLLLCVCFTPISTVMVVICDGTVYAWTVYAWCTVTFLLHFGKTINLWNNVGRKQFLSRQETEGQNRLRWLRRRKYCYSAWAACVLFLLLVEIIQSEDNMWRSAAFHWLTSNNSPNPHHSSSVWSSERWTLNQPVDVNAGTHFNSL